MNLRTMQEDAAKRLVGRPLTQAVMRGELQRAEYINYLSDVYCYALHSAQVIAIAGTRLTLTSPSMAEYLYRHAAEEMGHDKWAHSDLLELGVSVLEVAAIKPSSACLKMIGLEYLYAAHDNAMGLFGWMFALESLGGSLGGGMASAIDKTLQLNGKAMRFLRGHAEADSHHSEDLYRVISANLSAEADRVAFERMYSESLDAYCQILDSARLERRVAA